MVVKLKKNIALSESGYVFNPATGESYTVNPTGIEILNYIREGKSQEEISSLFLSKYNTDRATFEKDFTDFQVFLRQNMLIEDAGEKEN